MSIVQFNNDFILGLIKQVNARSPMLHSTASWDMHPEVVVQELLTLIFGDQVAWKLQMYEELQQMVQALQELATRRLMTITTLTAERDAIKKANEELTKMVASLKADRNQLRVRLNESFGKLGSPSDFSSVRTEMTKVWMSENPELLTRALHEILTERHGWTHKVSWERDYKMIIESTPPTVKLSPLPRDARTEQAATKRVPATGGHVFHHCDNPNCLVCDGGLSLCNVCGGAEGCMPRDCPGVKLSSTQLDDILAGRLDYRDGAFVTIAKEPK